MVKKIARLILSSLLISGILFLSACGGSVSDRTTNNNPAATPIAQTTGSNPTNVNTDKIEFKLENGSAAFAIKPKADGAKLVNANNQELARFNLDEKQKLKIKDAGDRVLGFIVTQNDYWKIENASQTQELYILRRQSDGDYKLEDGSDRQIYRIKQRDYGFEIETPTKQSLYKIKVKDGKTSLRDASDKTVLYIKTELTPIAIACFGFDVLTQEQKAALAYMVNLAGG
ncbi:MAG: hypothetical protein KME17_02845 [Cyanosarcina radialis HA8281-LM2]|jgi:hypothetical protein|nr:hypothetical protein [Cyanosarcina radialis HA8281-LM2]